MTKKHNITKYVVNKVTHDSKRDDDYVVRSMGAFGVWQALICLLAAVTRVIAGWNIITIVYLTPKTHFICTEFENGAEPLEVINTTCYDGCLKYEYENIIFESTLISEFDLICDRAWLASFTQSMLMFGLFLGVNFFGWVSDRFGRRMSLICGVAIPVMFSLAAPFAPNYWTFCVIRFFVGLGCGGIFTVSVVIIVEIIGPQYREFGGGLGIVIDGIGQSTVVIFAYYARTWRMLMLCLGSTSILILLMTLFFLPETPRWLMANQQGDRAVELMIKVAKFNNLPTENIKENVEKSMKEIEEKQKYQKESHGFLDLFKTKELTLVTIFSTIIWSVAGVCFFGINQYVPLLGSNVHMTVLASGLVQIPAALVGMGSNKCFGRKGSSFFFVLLIALAMGILAFLPDGNWAAVIAVTGLFSATTLFSILYVQINELFPTVLRNMGFAVSSAGAKLGAMIAPFIVNVKPHWVSSVIFSLYPLFCAGFSLLLPETKGLTLKDTIF
ncbi:solute carrier family 22 member 15 [Amyelois transitella]|uniref:solute carrier family 22 member 15 n=1 Tax=Amyelois transitella TaxID=680683 RepID=UPI00067C138C|nr:solute carrier family 22 member 15 [Amyelois transitella]